MLQAFETDCFFVNESSCKKNLKKVADKRQIDYRTIETYRGIIYDRNGEILAMSLPKKTLCININKIYKPYINKEVKLNELLNIINLSKSQFNSIIKKNKNKKEYYLKRKLNNKKVEKIKNLNLPYIYFIDEYHRVYLGGEYFSNVIGFTDIDDNGQDGVELAKNQYLQSTRGIKKVRKDNLGRSVELLDIIQKPKAGNNIYLSMDKRIQFIGYKILKQHVNETKADSASLVLIKNKTGEIISMINYPSFNPDNRKEISGKKVQNLVTSSLFEPGSTIKPFIGYTGLYSGSHNINDIINTSHGFKLTKNSKPIKDYKNLGPLTLEGVIEKSSNVGAAMIAKKTKKEYIHDTLQKLDFGNNLYIGLPGAQNGSLKNYHKWDEALHGTLGYGYGLSTTLLHLANAYTTLANYGKKVELTYEKRLDDDFITEQVLDKNISKQVLKMMEKAVNTGTGKKAKLKNYSVAGKTGTARINKGGGYSEFRHNAIFVGITPASNPEYVAAIIIRHPKNGEAAGGKNAAPVFKEFMSHALNLLEVYPDIK